MTRTPRTANTYIDLVKNREPIMSAATIGAFLLAAADRVFNFYDADLDLLAPVAFWAGGLILRQLVYSPASYLRALHARPPADPEATTPDPGTTQE